MILVWAVQWHHGLFCVVSLLIHFWLFCDSSHDSEASLLCFCEMILTVTLSLVLFSASRLHVQRSTPSASSALCFSECALCLHERGQQTSLSPPYHADPALYSTEVALQTSPSPLWLGEHTLCLCASVRSQRSSHSPLW